MTTRGMAMLAQRVGVGLLVAGWLLVTYAVTSSRVDTHAAGELDGGGRFSLNVDLVATLGLATTCCAVLAVIALVSRAGSWCLGAAALIGLGLAEHLATSEAASVLLDLHRYALLAMVPIGAALATALVAEVAHRTATPGAGQQESQPRVDGL